MLYEIAGYASCRRMIGYIRYLQLATEKPNLHERPVFCFSWQSLSPGLVRPSSPSCAQNILRPTASGRPYKRQGRCISAGRDAGPHLVTGVSFEDPFLFTRGSLPLDVGPVAACRAVRVKSAMLLESPVMSAAGREAYLPLCVFGRCYQVGE